ncbi:acetyltransferase [Virgibacillus soli]|nr:acetyltransferase [Virgibacillus soli]
MKKKLLIIGASGHGKVVADIALKMKKWRYIAFLDDNQNIKSSLELDVIGKTVEIHDYIKDYDIFVGIGNNEIRARFHEELEKNGASIATLVHPDSIIGGNVNIASGTVVMAGVIINCGTSIGKGCIINTGSTIDHDNNIGEFVHISPGVHLAGTVKIGNSSWLGIGSIVSNNLSIGNKCKIGAGAVVVKDITEAGTYIGIPAIKLTS